MQIDAIPLVTGCIAMPELALGSTVEPISALLSPPASTIMIYPLESNEFDLRAAEPMLKDQLLKLSA